MGGGFPGQLIGRDPDVEFVCGFVDEAAVRGGALLVSGDAGVGKTALLDVAALHAEAAGTRVVRAVGAEFEAELSFSGLNHVLHPLLDGLAVLPPMHRQALSVALGLDAGAPADRLVVSNAVLALLRDAAVTRPLLVVVDDLPWLDRASSLVLASAVRRLAGTRVGFLAALRTEAESFFDRAGLPSYELEPLDDAAATSLLEQRFPALAPPVRERLVAEAQGNPLALLELPIALRDAEPARRQLADVLPLTARLQDLFASRIRALPEPTIDLLLIAVLDGTGDLRVLEAAAPGESGLDDLAAAERARIVQVDESAGATHLPAPLDPLGGRCPLDERPAASRSPSARRVRVGSRASRLASRRGGGWSRRERRVTPRRRRARPSEPWRRGTRRGGDVAGRGAEPGDGRSRPSMGPSCLHRCDRVGRPAQRAATARRRPGDGSRSRGVTGRGGRSRLSPAQRRWGCRHRAPLARRCHRNRCPTPATPTTRCSSRRSTTCSKCASSEGEPTCGRRSIERSGGSSRTLRGSSSCSRRRSPIRHGMPSPCSTASKKRSPT